MSRPRPRSPHVQVYRPQLTSVLSILHRLSGIGLSVGAAGFAVWLIAVAVGGDTYATIASALGSWPGQVALFVWTYLLFYHLCNGLRHLFWDAGRGFELVAIYASGWAVVVASIVLTLFSWLLAAMIGA